MKMVDLTLLFTLLYVEPRVWRRAVVSGDFILSDLHYVIQTLFDWDDAHLWQFEFGKHLYSPGDDEDGEDDEFTPVGGTHGNADETLLLVALGRLKKFSYTYDFGDDWKVDIAVESGADATKVSIPVCLDGARAGPPDDIGGPPGYANFCEAMSDPKHPDHADMKDWIDGEWDAEAFDIKAINKDLKRGFAGLK